MVKRRFIRMRTAARWTAKAIGGLLAIYFLLYVWPTPYRYYYFADRGYLRINRVTGVIDRATYGGWVNSPPQRSQP
jgi:hypothetical protein